MLQINIKMQSTSKLHGESYRNWVRGATGLSYLQEGLQTFADDVVKKEQSRILREIGKCTNCQTDEILPKHTTKTCIQHSKIKCNCRKKHNKYCNICSNIYDEIITQHRYRDPVWQTDSSKWCTDHWQIAKCFMTTTSKGLNNKAGETDAAGLLSLIINGMFFGCELDCIIDPPNDVFSRARDIRNEILHEATLQLNDSDVATYLQVMIDVLEDKRVLINDDAAKAAVRQLKEIQNDKLIITTEVQAKATKVALKSIELAKEIAEDSIKAIAEKSQKSLEEQKAPLLENITSMKDEVHSISHSHTALSSKLDEDYEPEIKRMKEITKQHEDRLTTIENEAKNMKAKQEKVIELLNTAMQQHLNRLEYLERNCDLKEDLIVFNEKHHSTIPYSPLEDDAPLLDFYVLPEMASIEIEKSVSCFDRQEIKTPVKSLKDIFHKQSTDKLLNDIYVISDAGMGKTAFGKLLAVTWCHSHKPDRDKNQSFADEDLQTMKEFEFLFALSLRDVMGSVNDVDQMIQHQIIGNLSRSTHYTMEFLEEILHKETCLIILDGLDEWSSQDSKIQIPRRKARRNSTILTTTRTWKFSALNLSICDIDQKVEIRGLGEESSLKLVKNVLSKLTNKIEVQSSVDIDKFYEQIQVMNIEELVNIPMILLYLVCLWHDEKSIGKSRCEIYSSIIEFLLSHAEQKSQEINRRSLLPSTDVRNPELPHCFEEHEYSGKYGHLLGMLAHLAFKTLFSDIKESTIVFDNAVAERILSKPLLDLCFTIGLLTKSKLPLKLTKKMFKVSFQHKTFQEFFAALHISLSYKSTQALNTLINSCQSVEPVLEMGNVLIFLGGLCPEALSVLSENIKDAIASDSNTQLYRCDALSFKYITKYSNILSKLLKLHIFCIQENTRSGNRNTRLYFEDFILDDYSCTGEAATALKRLMETNIKGVKSLKIDNMQKTARELQDMTNQFSLNEICTLERLDYWGPMEKENLCSLLRRSASTLKSLTVHGIQSSLQLLPVGRHINISTESFYTLQTLENLETISFWYIKLTHIQLGDMLNCFARKQNMKYIGLEDVQCSDHFDNCNGFSFDLSSHTQLKVLNIGHIPLSDIQINTCSLEECRIVHFPTPDVLPAILQYLPAADKLETFVCHYLTEASDIEHVLNILPRLRQIKRIRFLGIDFSQKTEILPANMDNFEYLRLIKVTLTGTALRNMIKVVENYNKPVEIQLQDCKVVPDDEFGNIKTEVRRSKVFDIELDGKNDRGGYEFTLKKQ